MVKRAQTAMFSNHPAMRIGLPALVGVFALASGAVGWATGCATTSPERPTAVALIENRPPPKTAKAPVERAAAPTDPDRETVQRVVAVLDELGELSAGGSGDCARAAAMIEERVEGHRDLWIELSAIDSDPDRRHTLDASATRIADSLERLGLALGPCASDPRVATSLEGMSGR